MYIIIQSGFFFICILRHIMLYIHYHPNQVSFSYVYLDSLFYIYFMIQIRFLFHMYTDSLFYIDFIIQIRFLFHMYTDSLFYIYFIIQIRFIFMESPLQHNYAKVGGISKEFCKGNTILLLFFPNVESTLEATLKVRQCYYFLNAPSIGIPSNCPKLSIRI